MSTRFKLALLALVVLALSGCPRRFHPHRHHHHSAANMTAAAPHAPTPGLP